VLVRAFSPDVPFDFSTSGRDALGERTEQAHTLDPALLGQLVSVRVRDEDFTLVHRAEVLQGRAGLKSTL
jgi:hypothetical protein